VRTQFLVGILLLLALGCAHRAPRAEAGLTNEQIIEVLRERRLEVRDCLLAQKRANPMSASVTVYLGIQRDGRTSGVHVTEAYAETVLGRCLVEAVEGWRFPRFEGAPTPLDFPVVSKR